jgi:hypothetical protein
MTEEYIKRNPGDLITSEDWNKVQGLIKKDIVDQVGRIETDLNEFKEKPVDAEKFGGNTPDEWTKKFDDRYVQHAELEAGWGEYRRYFKQIDRKLVDKSFEPAIIKHNLHRYPVVNIFELDYLKNSSGTTVKDNDGNSVKFLVYYAGHRDPVAENLMTLGEDDVHWGDSFNLILEQFDISPNPEQYFDDVLNDLWGHMFDPGLSQDHFKRESYGHSKYIQTEILDKDRTVEQLTGKHGLWDDLRMAIRPRMIPAVLLSDVTESTQVQVYHLSQDILEIRVPSAMDLMILLRT